MNDLERARQYATLARSLRSQIIENQTRRAREEKADKQRIKRLLYRAVRETGYYV